MSTPNRPRQWWVGEDWTAVAVNSWTTGGDAFNRSAGPQIIAYLLASGVLASLLAIDQKLDRIAAALEGLEAGR